MTTEITWVIYLLARATSLTQPHTGPARGGMTTATRIGHFSGASPRPPPPAVDPGPLLGRGLPLRLRPLSHPPSTGPALPRWSPGSPWRHLPPRQPLSRNPETKLALPTKPSREAATNQGRCLGIFSKLDLPAPFSYVPRTPSASRPVEPRELLAGFLGASR